MLALTKTRRRLMLHAAVAVYDDPALTEPDPWFGDEQVMTTLRSTFDRLAPEYTGPRYPEAVLQLRELVAFAVIEEGAAPQGELERAQQEIESLD